MNGEIEIRYKAIGIIHSPFKEMVGTPIQPESAKGIEGSVEVFKEYEDGLIGIEQFSHVILIYHFHLTERYSLRVKPYMAEILMGVFATRAPARPNPIGLSIVELIERNGRFLKIRNVDVVDNTPLLDIKPYVPSFDAYMKNVRIGWLEKHVHKLRETKDDGRFLQI